MDECPHCGEPISPDAESCPHCGSDAETGWNPDAEYLGVELPGDELYEVDAGRATSESGDGGWGGVAWRTVAGHALVIAAGAWFFVGARAFADPVSLLVFVLLAVSFLASGAQVRAREGAGC